jgi:hypothetical protein
MTDQYETQDSNQLHNDIDINVETVNEGQDDLEDIDNDEEDQQGGDTNQEELDQRRQVPPTQNNETLNQQGNTGANLDFIDEGTLDNQDPDPPYEEDETTSLGSYGLTLPVPLERLPAPMPIEFDDTEPFVRPARRSTNSMNETIRNARRQSNATFQSPPANSRRSSRAPAAQAGGGPPSSSSSSTNTGPPRRQPPGGGPGGNGGGGPGGGGAGPVCTLCGGAHQNRNCPNRIQVPIPVCRHCARQHATNACPTLANNVNQNRVLVDGRNLQVRNVPVSVHNYVRRRIWNKYTRWSLPTDERIAFDKQASGYVLAKGNKLRVQSQLTIDEDILKNVHNLQHQIKSLKEHVIEHDMLDVCMIVLPKDLNNTPDLESTKYNLFDDYPKLTPTIVANSNAYYSRWVDNDFISENLNLTYTLCKNNTEDTLFNKCLEEYDTYHPMQRGGPLILCLLLLRIHNASEQHMDYLKLRVETLKISTLEGESVDVAVSLINSAYATFQSISTPTKDRIPPEWCKTLITVFQTTSVPEFNETFKDEEKGARRSADKNGGQPNWPTHEQLTRLATTTYNRLKVSGEWDVPKASRAKSYNAVGSPGGTTPGYKQPFERTCWNCGSKDHMLNDCTRPRDEAKVTKARQQFRARRPPNSQGQRRPQPQHKKIDGKPMILNKKGAYVLDQKKIQDKRKKGQFESALTAIRALNVTSSSRPKSMSASDIDDTSPEAPEDQTIDPITVRSILQGLL